MLAKAIEEHHQPRCVENLQEKLYVDDKTSEWPEPCECSRNEVQCMCEDYEAKVKFKTLI